ncbi:MAG TPA: FAD-binding domain [Rhizomicrobium sp.]|nr:FAD-binding domain [Rhizomicrobium sp.]
MRMSVLIAGAGIAGPALAFWLKASGFQPTLVERAPRLRSGGYVIDFWGLGYDIAARMGLEKDLHATGYHVEELRVVDDAGRRIAGFGTKVFTELTDGRYVSLRRSDLSRLIFDKTKDDVETIFGDEIAHLTEEAAGVRVRFRGGSERTFDLVVGADGLHSGVRDLAFGRESRFEKDLGYAVAAFEAAGYRPRDEDAYLMHGQPGWMLGRFTMRDDRALFLFIFANGHQALPATLSGQKALLHDRYAGGKWETPAILAALDRTGELYFDRVSQIRMPRWSKGRIALIGDAAFCVSLTAGQGSALAMVSAYVLAGELAKAAGNHSEAFAAYEEILKNYIGKKQRGAEHFARAFAPRTRFGLWFRDMTIRSFAIPGLAKLGVGRDMMDRLILPEYRWPLVDHVP